MICILFIEQDLNGSPMHGPELRFVRLRPELCSGCRKRWSPVRGGRSIHGRHLCTQPFEEKKIKTLYLTVQKLAHT